MLKFCLRLLISNSTFLQLTGRFLHILPVQFIDEFPYCGIILFDKSFHPEIIQVSMNGATMSKMVDKLLKLNILLGKAISVSKVLQLLIILHRYSSMANSKENGIVNARYTNCIMMLNTRGELDALDSCLWSTETRGMVSVITSYSMIRSYCLFCVHSPTSQHSCSMRMVELSAASGVSSGHLVGPGWAPHIPVM